MFKTYKYRLYPTESQRALIDHTINVCRLIHNLALEVKIASWQSLRVSVKPYQLFHQIVELRAEYKWIKEVDSHALRASVQNVESAFDHFFKGICKFPRFKRKQNMGSFKAQSDPKKVDFENNTITIAKTKAIVAVISRRFEGTVKHITILRTSTGKYFAHVCVKTNDVEPKLFSPTVGIGVDVGIKDFATISTGEKIANPKYLSSKIERLKVLQRRINRKNKGSKNRRKAVLKMAILHERITNKRNDFLHKISSKLIGDNQTDTICVETLAVKNMIRNHNLAQAISDVSWYEFVRQLEYKGRWYGKNVIKIDKWFASSKTCSNCGHKYSELNLSERMWTCSKCNTNHDRDINAAINIRNSGMGSPVEPVELLPIGRAMKQESIPISKEIK